MQPLVSMPGQSGAENSLEFVTDFVTARVSTTAGEGDWLLTTDNSGTAVVTTEAGGWLLSTPGTAADDFNSLQLNGAAFSINDDTNLEFFIRFKTNDADDIKFFVGLATSDITGSTAGPVLDGTNDSIGFRNTAGNTAAFDYVLEDDTTETSAATGYSLVDDTAIGVGFSVIGRRYVRFYVMDGSGNEIEIAKTGVNIPDDGALLTPTIEVGSPTGTTATTISVDQLVVRQTPRV